MKGDSDITVDLNETEMAEVTDDSCTVEFIEIVPLDRASDDYHPLEFIDPAVEVKLKDLVMKQEPADENHSEVPCFNVRVTSVYIDIYLSHCHSVA